VAVTGRSLHIGLNSVDPTHYAGWDGVLSGCEFDARDMAQIAESRGFDPTVVLTKDAVAGAIMDEVRKAGASLRPGDIFLLTYSGHGGQVPDLNGDEPDHQDETWVLYDRQLVDDELYALWGAFAAGVRILVVSDSCHSGSVTRAAFYDRSPANGEGTERFKNLPLDVQRRTYEANESLYAGIQSANPQGDAVGVGASCILLSGCQDNQFSRDGDRNGLFTQTLKEVWDGGKYAGTYRMFWRQVVDKMPPDQTPGYFRVGVVDPTFEQQNPFTM
jgi:metacaspase-1